MPTSSRKHNRVYADIDGRMWASAPTLQSLHEFKPFRLRNGLFFKILCIYSYIALGGNGISFIDVILIGMIYNYHGAV